MIAFIICMDACREDSSEKSINEFRFETSKNQGLTKDVVAKIDNSRITVILPSGANIKSLVASFSHTGKKVSVGNKEQTSGVSVNDFSSPVEYIVRAEDNSIQIYMVSVKVSDNTISSFAFMKSLNPILPADVRAVIRNDSIITVFPSNTNLERLIASYASNAASITVNGARQISGISQNNFSSTVEYHVEGLDGSKRTYRAVARSSNTTDPGNTFEGFWITKKLNPDHNLNDDIKFTIDHQNRTIEATYLRWINASQPSLMMVSFETEGILVELGGVVQNGEMSVNLKQPVRLAIAFGNEAPRTYTMRLFCPQINENLPVFRIIPDAPIVSKENYVTALLEIIGSGITEGLWNFNMGKVEIRLRGNSTMWLPKRPYRIKFPQKYSPLGLKHAREKSWVLLANDCDKSLIRNAVAFQISRILQTDAKTRRFTTCTQFVDLYLNDLYDGVYHLTDQVQMAPGRVEVQTLTKSDAGNASKISGGYFLEIDGFAFSEPVYFVSPKNMPVTIKYPDNDDYAPEQATWIANYFTTVENALFSQDFKNPNTGWRKYIDIASWVDHYIVNELAGNSDVWWQMFMSKDRNVDYFVLGPVWDFDIAFNNDNRISNATTRLMAEAAHDPKQWIRRFMEDETFKAAVKARWNAKKGELVGLTAYMDELAAKLDVSQKANFKRWDITQQALGHANPAPASYEAAINQLKNYFQARYNYLDTEFNKW